MDIGALTEAVSFQHALDGHGAGTSDQDGEIIDLQDYDAVAFAVRFGTIASGAVTSILIRESDTTTSGDFETVDGTSRSVPDDGDNEWFVTDLAQIKKRYARVRVDRGTANATIVIGLAAKYKSREKPVTQHSDTTVTVTATA